MKFEIVEEMRDEKFVKVKLKIDEEGDLLLSINNILIAYIDSVNGKFIRCECLDEEINILRKIGIMIDDGGKIEIN